MFAFVQLTKQFLEIFRKPVNLPLCTSPEALPPQPVE
jgi:hypothetical protein